MALAFTAPPRDAWFPVGLASTYFDVTSADAKPLAEHAACGTDAGTNRSGCKVFLAPDTDASSNEEGIVELSADPKEQIDASLRKGEQVLVFQYNGKFHAVDNKCPHSSYPLSNATPFDIEDFGVTLSAGISCPKHDWSFDLFTGMSDRGKYKLKRWEVQVRVGAGGEADKEVWVRRRQRVG